MIWVTPLRTSTPLLNSCYIGILQPKIERMRSDLVSPVIFIAFLCLSLSEQVWLLYFQQKHLVEQRRYFFLSELAGNPSIFCFSCQYQYQYQYQSFILPAARKLSALRLIWLFRDWERCIRVPTIQQGLDLSNGDFNGFHNFNYHGIILLRPWHLFPALALSGTMSLKMD